MNTASMRMAVAIAFACLVVSACGTDETVHPFGGEALGAQSGGGGGGSGGLVRGIAGSMGTLDAITSVGGGTGSGGVQGTGGATGTGGASGPSAACQQYIWDYDTELQHARECNQHKTKACALLIPQRLAGCGSGCFMYVEKADKLEELQKQWIEDECTPVACDLEACINPGSATCSVVSGLCTDGLP